MANITIPERWKDKLSELPPNDFKVLIMAIITESAKPDITKKYQPIADNIYDDIERMNYQKMAMRKSRKKNKERLTVTSQLINSELTVTQREREEALPPSIPPSPPSSLPPNPYYSTPLYPPLTPSHEEEKEKPPTPTPVLPAKVGVTAVSREVIGYLNEVCGTRYKPEVKATLEHISARLKEGFTVEDFKTVIDKKNAEWHGTEYEQYLRPQTLFCTKFESYLMAPIRQRRASEQSGDSFLDYLNSELDKYSTEGERQ